MTISIPSPMKHARAAALCHFPPSKRFPTMLDRTGQALPLRSMTQRYGLPSGPMSRAVGLADCSSRTTVV